MLKIEFIYLCIGALLAIGACFEIRRKRWSMAAFWAVLSVAFLFGAPIKAATAVGVRWPSQAMGVGVIALGVLAALGAPRKGAQSEDLLIGAMAQPVAKGTAIDVQPRTISTNRLFVSAAVIPLVTVLLVLLSPYLTFAGKPLIEPAQRTLVCLGIACIIAFVVALTITRASPTQGLEDGCRLLDALGFAALLPMVLATLGGVFAATGVGDALAALVTAAIPTENRYACLLAFAFGMVVLTMIMGNAFAAFPVLMAGIGLPLLVTKHAAAPAILGAMGMLTGYCGTLLTPMAANFNIVPVVLLQLRDDYAVIRAQAPTAFWLLAINVLLLALLVFK